MLRLFSNPAALCYQAFKKVQSLEFKGRAHLRLGWDPWITVAAGMKHREIVSHALMCA